MAMVESGLGISVLPELILKRIPYRIVTRELEIPAYRNIGLAMRNRKGATPAVKRFLSICSIDNKKCETFMKWHVLNDNLLDRRKYMRV